MECKVPEPSKACCCLPLRKGLIFLIYVNLVLLVIASSIFIFVDHIKRQSAMFNHSRPMEYVNTFAIIVVLVGDFCELIMMSIALFGLHKEKLKLVRAYYYYTVIYTVFVAVSRTLNVFNIVSVIYEIPVVIPFLGFKCYYILLLRSQAKKMKKKQREKEFPPFTCLSEGTPAHQPRTKILPDTPLPPLSLS